MSSAKDYQRVRNSAEEDEIEMDRLLVQGRSANGQGRNTQTSNGKNAGAQKDENGRLMYDVDEEGRRMSGNSRLSEEMDRAKLNDLSQKRKTSLAWRFCKWSMISFALLVLFILLSGGAYKASGKNFEDLPYVENLPIFGSAAEEAMDNVDEMLGDGKATEAEAIEAPYKPEYLSNGTSMFAPTTILISLDGFKPEYLRRGVTPGLNVLYRNGVSPLYMTPSFPSVTFPNHYTMVTGMNPESHGIVGNTFIDPATGEEFNYQVAEHSMQPKWWSAAEPIWVTLEDQGIPTAIHMWPGSEAHIPDVSPTFLDTFNSTELLGVKVNRIMELLYLPGPKEVELNPSLSSGPTRPQFVAAYVPDVDRAAHRFGPNSTEVTEAVKQVDLFIRTLFYQLNEASILPVVNLVVVSDHGMAATDISRLIQLEDLIDPDLIESTEGWPNYGIRLKDPDQSHLATVYNRLLQQTAIKDGFCTYLRDTNMPERFHFHNNDRIAPLWLMPKPGWAIVTKEEIDVAAAQANGDVFHPKGIHGYDNEAESMQAIFVAQGPAFPHKGGSRVAAFQNTNVYNIICDSLGITPRPNNGTLRLPLELAGIPDTVPGGFIADEDAPGLDFEYTTNFDDAKNGVAMDPPVDVSPSVVSVEEAVGSVGVVATEAIGSVVAAATEGVASATEAAFGIATAPATEDSIMPGTGTGNDEPTPPRPTIASDDGFFDANQEEEELTPQQEDQLAAAVADEMEKEYEQELAVELEEEFEEEGVDWKEWFGDEFDDFKDWVGETLGGKQKAGDVDGEVGFDAAASGDVNVNVKVDGPVGVGVGVRREG